MFWLSKLGFFVNNFAKGYELLEVVDLRDRG